MIGMAEKKDYTPDNKAGEKEVADGSKEEGIDGVVRLELADGEQESRRYD
jgi:hypothetical protein